MISVVNFNGDPFWDEEQNALFDRCVEDLAEQLLSTARKHGYKLPVSLALYYATGMMGDIHVTFEDVLLN